MSTLATTAVRSRARARGATWVHVALSVFIWSFAFVGIRYGVRYYSPGALALLRFTVASAMFAGFIVWKRDPRSMVRRATPHWRGILAMSVTGIFVYHVCLNVGELTVSAGAASLLVNTTPVFTVLLAMWFLGDRLGPVGGAGIAVAFLGATLVSLGTGEGFSFDQGALWITAAAVAQAIYFTVQKELLGRLGPLELTALSIWSGTLLLAVFSGQLVDALTTAPLAATLAVVSLGVGPSAIAYLSWAEVVSRIDVSRAVTYLYLVPVLAFTLGFLLLGEEPGLLSVLGGAVTLFGVALVHRR